MEKYQAGQEPFPSSLFPSLTKEFIQFNQRSTSFECQWVSFHKGRGESWACHHRRSLHMHILDFLLESLFFLSEQLFYTILFFRAGIFMLSQRLSITFNLIFSFPFPLQLWNKNYFYLSMNWESKQNVVAEFEIQMYFKKFQKVRNYFPCLRIKASCQQIKM